MTTNPHANMKILALDTCTEMCSVALLNQNVLFNHALATQRGHSEQILGMLDTLLERADVALGDIDLLAFGRGPGSFTGVRVGVGVAQGIAFARRLPVVPVSTLAAVAQRAIDEHGASQIAVAMDARMGEVYAAHYREVNGLAVLCDREQVCHPSVFRPRDESMWFAAGTGWTEHEDALKRNFGDQLSGEDSTLLPLAAAMTRLAHNAAEKGRAIAAEMAMPVYLRDKVAKKKGEQ